MQIIHSHKEMQEMTDIHVILSKKRLQEGKDMHLIQSFKAKYQLHSAKYRAASALHYSCNQINIAARRQRKNACLREEYALCQPKPAVLQQYAYALRNKLMHDSKSRALLRDSFNSH